MARPRPLLRYAADVHSLARISAAALISFAPFLLKATHLPSPWWLLAALWFVTVYARSYPPYAQHNQGHLPVFHAWPLNTLYDAVLTQLTGYPTAFWELQHTRGHHKHFLNPEADPARIVHRTTGVRMSRLWYAIRGNVMIPFDSAKIALAERRRGRPHLVRKLAFELVLQIGITAALFVWSPVLTVVFLVVPSLFVAFFVWWESYVHHLHVPSTSVYDGCVSITGARFNARNFNIGHHTAHHEKPTLHWSLLPERTKTIAARIPDVCIRENEGPGHAAESAGASPASTRETSMPLGARFTA